jgi:hypothetical protein
MKRQFLTVAAVAALSTYSTLAAAGNGTSGGGAAVVCRGPKGEVQKAFLYDTYAAANDTRNPRKVLISDKPPGQQVEAALKRIARARRSDGPGRDMWSSTIRRALGLVKRDWLPLKEGTRLPFVPDFEPEFISDGKDCKAETMAHYDDATSNLRVDMAIYAKLSNTDRAALYLHEALYKIDRLINGVTSSKPTRERIDALLTASNDPRDRHLMNVMTPIYMNVSSDNDEVNLNPARFDLWLGAKTLHCEDPKNKATHLDLKNVRNSDAETGIGMSLRGFNDTMGWGGDGLATLQRLQDLGTTAKTYSDKIVIGGESGSDMLSMTTDWWSTLEDDAFVHGKTFLGHYSYVNERDAGNKELDVVCIFQ